MDNVICYDMFLKSDMLEFSQVGGWFHRYLLAILCRIVSIIITPNLLRICIRFQYPLYP